VERDEGLPPDQHPVLRALTPVSDDGYHTVGTSSQIADQPSAVLVVTTERADELGLPVRTRIVDRRLVRSDPVLMLTGPIPATRLPAISLGQRPDGS
jgi:acetyl-CoA C-acetyltransferase